MTRLRSLIKEALSTPPNKKDCGCGCNTCDGKKSPIITEGKIKNAISEGLKYHVDKNIPLHESVYRIGSEKHFALINEARKLWVRGLINVSEDDQAILETHLGNFGMYEGEKVPLDMPMVNEEKYYITRNLGRGQGMSLVKDKEFKSYEDAKEEADKLERGSRNMTAYFVSDKDMNRIEESLNEDDNRKHALLRVEPRNYEVMIDKLQDMNINHRRESDTVIKVYTDNLSDRALYNLTHDVYVDKFVLKESLNEEKAITFKPGTLSDMELATKILDKEGIEYKIDNFDLILSDEDYLVVLDYLKGRNNVNVNLSTSILNEDEAAFEYNKARAGRIMKDLFGPDFEFDYTYKLEGDRIIIHPEGYNPDGTLFDMKDIHKEKIIRTFRDKMPKAQATPNMGGGITVRLRGFSLNEVHKLLRQTNLSSEEYQKAKKLKGFNADNYTFNSDNNLYVKKETLEEKKKAKSKKKDPPIGKPKRGGSKAYYVYVRDPKTKRIKKVSFGSGGLRAKIRNPKARKAFAARHRCSEKNDRTKASYWSCRLPRYAKQLGLGSNMNTFW